MISRHPMLMGKQSVCLEYLMVRFSLIITCHREIHEFMGISCVIHTEGVVRGSMLKEEYKLLHLRLYFLNVILYERDQGGKLSTKMSVLLCCLQLIRWEFIILAQDAGHMEQT
jgi:hypothetical protein